jgi:hypothetical protein
MIEITDEEIESLPDDDDEMAFVKFERIARIRYEEEARNWGANETPRTPMSEYMNLVVAAAKHYGIAPIDEWEETTSKPNSFQSFSAFTAAVDRTTLEIRLRSKDQSKRQSVFLDAATKLKMRHHLNQVRAMVDEAAISADKKDSLYRCISALEIEIDRDRTRMQAFYDLFIKTCTVAGEGAKAAEPLIQAVERLGAAVGIAQESAVRPRLPAPETKKIEDKTRKEKSNQNGFDKALDDEIPF